MPGDMTPEGRAAVEADARLYVDHGAHLGRPIRLTLAVMAHEIDRLRALPVIDRCSLCSWAHCDTTSDGVCTHPDTRPRCAPIDPREPPPAWCPLRGAR